MSADDKLASGHVPILYFVRLDFASGSRFYTNWGHNLDWDSHTWVGLGNVVSVSSVGESEQLQSPSLDLGLSVSNPSILALALGQVSDYRRRPVRVWWAVLDDELRRQDEPELLWAGYMDQVRVKTGNGEKEAGGVTLRCEQPGRDGRGPQSLRLNDAQHQARHPGDTGLSRIEALTGQPQLWLSKRFQRIG